MKNITVKQLFNLHPYLKKSLFAEKAGIPRNRMSEILAGTIQPNEEQIEKLNQFVFECGKELINIHITGA